MSTPEVCIAASYDQWQTEWENNLWRGGVGPGRGGPGPGADGRWHFAVLADELPAPYRGTELIDAIAEALANHVVGCPPEGCEDDDEDDG
jgi:hypothetical protein